MWEHGFQGQRLLHIKFKEPVRIYAVKLWSSRPLNFGTNPKVISSRTGAVDRDDWEDLFWQSAGDGMLWVEFHEEPKVGPGAYKRIYPDDDTWPNDPL